MPREAATGTLFVPGIASIAKNVMGRWKLHFKRNKSSLHLRANAMFLLAWATPRVTRAACLEPKRMRKRAPRGMKELAQRQASAKPVSSAVLLLQDVAPKNDGCQGSHTTGPEMTLTTFSSETIATP